MRLIFLGTGPATAIPRVGHRDAACRDARCGGRSRRMRSAAILQSGRTTVLIDAGPDIAEQLNREKIRRIDGVVLTHGHADASGGIKLLDQWLGRNRGAKPVTIWTDQRTKSRLRRKFPWLKCLRLKCFKPYQPIHVGSVTLTPFPVKHSLTPGFPTFGYVVGKSFAYASDVAEIPSHARRALKNISTLILDGAMYLEKSMAAHLSADQAIDYASALGARRLFLTQIGHSYPPHAIAQKQIRIHLKKLKIHRPSKVILAYDGMKIKI